MATMFLQTISNEEALGRMAVYFYKDLLILAP